MLGTESRALAAALSGSPRPQAKGELAASLRCLCLPSARGVLFAIRQILAGIKKTLPAR